MIEKQIYKTNNKSKITINIPEKFRNKKKLLIVIDDSIDSEKDKIELMKKAANDQLFIDDIEQVTEDFKHTDKDPS